MLRLACRVVVATELSCWAIPALPTLASRSSALADTRSACSHATHTHTHTHAHVSPEALAPWCCRLGPAPRRRRRLLSHLLRRYLPRPLRGYAGRQGCGGGLIIVARGGCWLACGRRLLLRRAHGGRGGGQDGLRRQRGAAQGERVLSAGSVAYSDATVQRIVTLCRVWHGATENGP